MPITDRRKRREWQRNWLKKRREAFFVGKECTFCRSGNRLELDHINPATKTHHAVWSWSARRRAAEITKCRILCHDCHVKRHAEEKRTRKHGTVGMYERGCKCDKCRHGACARVAIWRASRRIIRVPATKLGE